METGDGVILAFDSAVTDEDGELDLCSDKGFTIGAIGFVCVGDSRPAQVLRGKLEIKAPSVRDDVEAWGRTELADTVRELFDKHEFESGITMLVATRGELLYMHPDYTVYRSSHGYGAIGSGARCAYGALSAMQNYTIEVEEICELAVKAACTHQADCRLPVHSIFVPAFDE